MKYCIFLFLIFYGINIYSQKNDSVKVKYWSETDRLTLAYFNIEKTIYPDRTCNFHGEIKFYGFKYKGKSKEYIKRSVLNFMIDDSWIDTSFNVSNQLKYMQVQFDLSEVHARRLRKELVLKETFNTKVINKVKKNYLERFSAEFEKLEKETADGKNTEVVDSWERYVKSELLLLETYAVN